EPERLVTFLEKGYKTGQGDSFYRIGPLKLLTDGSLGAGTAYLKEPYSDEPDTKGISVFTQEELDHLVTTAHKGGMQILTHAIGDGAMEMCFRSFERALESMPKDDPRFGIVHLQITDEELLRNFREQSVIAFAEPICVNNDLHMAESRVGHERIINSYKYRTLLDNGVRMCISSDCPVDSLDPMDSLYVATTRKDYSGYPEDGWYPEEKLTMDQAVYSFTMGSAYASFEENIKGSIEPGKLADVVVLSGDPFEAYEQDIRRIKPVMTIMNGTIRYEKL
ncbi:MAG TPA: amidohydrolase family protein, partial [Gudongella oleilytica]|nr:amidohydrolase family protein [Gudongella oleilytica]